MDYHNKNSFCLEITLMRTIIMTIVSTDLLWRITGELGYWAGGRQPSTGLPWGMKRGIQPQMGLPKNVSRLY